MTSSVHFTIVPEVAEQTVTFELHPTAAFFTSSGILYNLPFENKYQKSTAVFQFYILPKRDPGQYIDFFFKTNI